MGCDPANLMRSGHYPVEPAFSPFDLPSMIRWLQWNDRNGCYTDADCDLEGIERLTLETALESINVQRGELCNYCRVISPGMPYWDSDLCRCIEDY
jgi:hypothetical protein